VCLGGKVEKGFSVGNYGGNFLPTEKVTGRLPSKKRKSDSWGGSLDEDFERTLAVCGTTNRKTTFGVTRRH